MTRMDLFKARDVADLFDSLARYLGYEPTQTELRKWVNTILGPWHIPSEVAERCRQ